MPHQLRVIEENPTKAILNHEMRTGKSIIGARWVDHPCRAGNTYIITLKQNKKEWQGYGTHATVYTKEEFKKHAHAIKDPTAIVVDEAHKFGSPLFLKGRSQLATALYTLCRTYPDMHVLLLTATPVKNDAWSLHTLLCYIGVYYDYKVWRSEFFELKKMPFLRFPAWLPRKDWRERIQKYLHKHTDIVSLADIVEYLPPAESIVVDVATPRYVEPEDRVVTWMDEHQHEQQNKVAEILSLGYKKLIVVAHYTAQIDELARALAGDKPVYVLDGRTKDADEVKRQAQNAEECYFIVQASMGMGWDGYMFGALVFASMSHSNVNHTQMLGRSRHMKHLQPVIYYYLIGGRWDKRIYDCVMSGQNFNPHIYLHD